MAEHSTPEERTELPTDRRMGQIRKEGALFISNDTVTLISLFTGYYGLTFSLPFFLDSFKVTFRYLFKLIAYPEPITVQDVYRGFVDICWLFVPTLMILCISIAAASSLIVMLQTNWNVRSQWFKFQFKFLDPIGGLRRIFSIQGFVNVGKAILKCFFIIPIAYMALKPEAYKMVSLLRTSLTEVFAFTGAEMDKVFWRIAYLLTAIAIFDYSWGKYNWLKTNKMTKDEVKDERKAVEGDETMRRRMVAKGMQRIANRIQQAVPKATVVITNPTHYAVALQYDKGTMKAPRIVAKGTDFMALRIREIARESGVPIVERKTLARALYTSVEVGKEIPYELFKAVAEVLAYVYRLKNPWGWRKEQQAQR